MSQKHPWVTKHGTDPLLPEAENTSEIIEPPTEAEVEAAITGNMRNLMTVVKAVKKFKTLTANKRPPVMSSILGDSDAGRFSLPPGQLPTVKPGMPGAEHRSQSLTIDDRNATESALVAEGVHRDVSAKFGPDSPVFQIKRKPLAAFVGGGSEEEDNAALTRLQKTFSSTVEPNDLPPFRSSISHARTIDDKGRRGHAHDPLEDHLYLRIGPSTFAGHSAQDDSDGFFSTDDEYIVSESPGAADVDIYETAYRDEIERILARAQEQNKEPQVYLTRRVDEKLLQLSGLAGKLMAHGEDARSQIRDYAQFRERKAKVAEVSRALREAARTEYEKRRQERKAWIEAGKAEKAKSVANRGAANTPVESEQAAAAQSPEAISPKPLEPTNSWRAKAVDRGRHAKSAFSGFVNTVKKSRRSRDDVI